MWCGEIIVVCSDISTKQLNRVGGQNVECFTFKPDSLRLPFLGQNIVRLYDMIRYMIYLLTAVGLTPGGSSTVHQTFTHKQYTEEHNETEYTERNIHNNNNTYSIQHSPS
jgi:hypothetical protein